MKRDEYEELWPDSPNLKEDLSVSRKVLLWGIMLVVGSLAVVISLADLFGFIEFPNEFYKVAPLLAVGLAIIFHSLSIFSNIVSLIHIQEMILDSETRVVLYLKKIFYGFEEEEKESEE